MSAKSKQSATTKSASQTSETSKPSRKSESKKAEPSTDKKERKRRVVTKETIDSSFVELQSRIEAEIARLRDKQEKNCGIKFLRSINKASKILHSDTKRVMKLKKQTNRKQPVASGFFKPVRISPELAAFTGWDINGNYCRLAVTKHICEYIKSNHLYDDDDKRKILCDDKLKTLLKYDPDNLPLDKEGKPAVLNYFRLQKYLKIHFIKTETPAQPEPKTTDADKSKPESKTADEDKPKPKTKTTRSTSKKGKKAELEDEDDD